MGAKNDFFQTTYGDTNTYHSHPTDLPSNFHTEELQRYSESSTSPRGFDLTISNSSDSFQSVKYHLVYVYAPNGVTNASSSEIANLSSDLPHPGDCERYAFSGSLEPRLRLSVMSYVFAGMFLLGTVIQRYFVILGHDGRTEPRILFRTFMQSQMISIGFYGVLIFFFDPLDGMGVTALRLEWIVDVTWFATKIALMLFLFGIFLVGIIALYLQRNNIGTWVGKIIESEQEINRVEREWFRNG